MPDNVELSAGSGGATVAADLIGTVHFQRVKLVEGADGVNDGDIAATNPLPVDGSSVTQPVSAASLPLPTGASTAAKQPALGTAGTASADVISVQGIALMTALKVDGSAVTQPVSAASLPLPTGAATATLQGGGLPTTLGAGGGLKVDGSGTALPVSAASLPLPAGAATAAKQPALGTAGVSSADVISVQGIASGTGLPVSGTVTANAGTNLNTSALATEAGAVATIKTNTDPLVTVGGGGYVRQDSTATIAKETGGNLASAVTALQIIDNMISGSEAQVDVVTQPVRARTTDHIGAAVCTDALMNGLTALTPKFEDLSTATSGDQALVAAVVAKTIRILSLAVIATATTNAIYFDDGTATLFGDATRKIPLDVTGATGAGGLVLPHNPLGWFQTAAVNRPININLGSANGIVACCTYVEV